MQFVLEKGSMLIKRDEHLVFHGCVPVDDTGELLSFEVDGVARRGRELFDAIEHSVRRAFRERQQRDLDLLSITHSGRARVRYSTGSHGHLRNVLRG
ncbi:MAG: fructose-bisphosphatase class III [Polyangiaceae bacterium]